MPLKDPQARNAYNKAYNAGRRARTSAYNAQYRQAHGRRPDPPGAQRRWSLGRYGLTITDYDVLFQAQDGKCAICGRPELKRQQGAVVNLAVDHDHLTGVVRGLLCSACNGGLGHFGDSIERLLLAVAYLEQHGQS